MIKKIVKQKKIIMAGLLLVLLSGILPVFADAEVTAKQKNILIINSYHQGFTWSRDVTDGIISTFSKLNADVSAFVEYMDWKNYPTEENIRHLYDYYQYKYQNKKIDLLIAVDDAALEFVLENRAAMFSGAPVVFCGVNQEGVAQITAGYGNLTGVLEEVDPTDTIKMAQAINPSLKNVYVLFDNSQSGISTGKIVEEKIKAMGANLNIIPLNNLPYDRIIKDAGSYDKDSIILATTYYGDADGKIIEFEKASREIGAKSSVPVYHLYEMGLNNGAFGGSMTSGKIQGESAANLAARILKGENPDNIPVLTPKATRKVFDFNQLKRFDIPLKEIPKGSEVINKPFSFFETYRTLVLAVLAAFTLLIAFVLVLLFYVDQLNRMKRNISEKHEELTQIYEELTASEEELKQQFDEVSSVKEQLSVSEERFRLAADGSNAIIWDVDLLTMQYYFSDRWYELLGYERGEIDEANGGWRAIIHPGDAEEAYKARMMHLKGKTAFYNSEYRMKMKNGEYKWFNVRGKVLRDSHWRNTRFAGSLIDITESKENEARLQESYQELESTYEELTAAQEELKQQYDEISVNHEKIKDTEEKLTYIAYHDLLTGLLNKVSLYENSNGIFRSQNSKAALLFIDMDHFKYINDTMGHAFGDQLIIRVSERLTSLLRDNCSIYRLSGDEFIIIIQDIKGKEDAEEFASHILAGLNEEFQVLNSALHISLSIGIAMYPDHGSNIEDLLKYADIAMYKVKETGRKRYIVYDQLMNEVFTERVNIEKHLHAALENNEFELYYQPQLDLISGRITGLEALLRWNSPELGSVSPLKFIKVAEDTHFIIPLGAWVIKNACAFLKKLHDNGFPDISVSVNISMLQLIQKDFDNLVVDTLEFFRLEPGFLELEITESILMESFDTIGLKLERLSGQGVRIALDDFGKGYSSLSYLKQLPISTLKIDKSFIDNISTESDRNILTGQIVMLGRSMGMCVIAEGVERQEQLEYLLQHECHKIQGYLYSKPVPGAELIKLLEMSQK